MFLRWASLAVLLIDGAAWPALAGSSVAHERFPRSAQAPAVLGWAAELPYALLVGTVLWRYPRLRRGAVAAWLWCRRWANKPKASAADSGSPGQTGAFSVKPSPALPLPAHDDLHGRQRSRTTKPSPRALPGPYSSPASLPVAFLGRYGALPVDTALDGQRVQELGSRPWMRDQPRTGRSRGRAPATAPRDLQEGGRASRICASKLDHPTTGPGRQ